MVIFISVVLLTVAFCLGYRETVREGDVITRRGYHDGLPESYDAVESLANIWRIGFTIVAMGLGTMSVLRKVDFDTLLIRTDVGRLLLAIMAAPVMYYLLVLAAEHAGRELHRVQLLRELELAEEDAVDVLETARHAPGAVIPRQLAETRAEARLKSREQPAEDPADDLPDTIPEDSAEEELEPELELEILGRRPRNFASREVLYPLLAANPRVHPRNQKEHLRAEEARLEAMLHTPASA